MPETKTSNPLTEIEFSSLRLMPAVMGGLKQARFSHCTPIQALTLPPALEGKDVAGQAQTGTGKTAAFLLVIFQRLLEKSPGHSGKHPRALVLAPTRELALQIHKDALLLGTGTGLRFGLAYGGVDYEKQRKTLEAGVDVLIGTPGRIIDYFKQHVFNLKEIDVMVLDEADRMFDLGFIKDIRYVLRRLPPRDQRQCLMFSATLSHRVLELAYEHMNEPELLKAEAAQVTAENVKQTVYYPSNEEKLPLLISLLREIEDGRVLVFANTRAVTDRVERTLNANGIHAAAMSGQVPQKKRQTLLKLFHDGELPVLVATDVAARGLHIPDVTHVINFDLPQDAEDYVHRIGRTARLGAKGEAISFACEHYAFHLPEIEEFIGYAISVDQADETQLPEIKRVAARPRRDHRKSGGRNRPPRRHNKGGQRRR
ncbi:MAG: DEAD/DEAH box helicase [Xanthomonadales bacterium]|nr:DEAD/DEAH box helicase [Gammaproteobacteria bacterium]MBT8054970.1 DEAD/DEAH box helicase [Gammaproteobacteria bacterium]NND56352.1 DEAD/DEAH box helicase [Xanthomonadales bacterium]NNK52892.1 DEAD/DEAH box helicase [Xanthomonadales bacterium]